MNQNKTKKKYSGEKIIIFQQLYKYKVIINKRKL